MRARFFLLLLSAGLVAASAGCTVVEEQPATTPPPPPASSGETAATPPPPPPETSGPATVTVRPVETPVQPSAPGIPPDPPPPADGRYAIVMERPARVGVPTAFQAHGEKRSRQRRRIGSGQPTDQTEILAVRISGVHRVLEVDSTGDAVRTQIDIQSCTAEGTGRPEELIAAGSTLVIETAQRPAEGRFLVNGSPVSDRVRDHLKIIFSTSRNPTSDDDVFGSPGRPRRVGESWNVRTAPMVAEFASIFAGLRPSDIRGRVTLHGVVSQGGRSYLDIGVDVNIRIRGMANLPPGTRLTRSTMRLSPRGLFAVTEGVTSPRETMALASEINMQIPTPAGAATMEMTITESREITRQ